MPLVFRLKNNGTAIFHEDALKLCKGLSKVTKEEALYIILVYDYYSPFWQFDVEERRKLAMNRAFPRKMKDPELKQMVQVAIEDFKSLQYDPRRETIAVYKRKLQQLNAQLDSANTERGIATITKSTESCNVMIDKLQKQVEDDETMEEIKGGGELSAIEKWGLNRKEYLERWVITEKVSDKEEEVIDD